MKIVKANYEFITPINGKTILERIEQCARTCYKSENKITEGSAERMIKALVKNGHEAMLEHCSFTVKFTIDRGISHEIVRHRLASFAQESTRYCNYSKNKFNNEITVIQPFFYKEDSEQFVTWKKAMEETEKAYFNLLKLGSTPQEARSVLPTSLKTELVVTANIREWRNILKLRTSSDAHPQIREVMIPLLKELQEKIPALFDDIIV